MATKRTNKTATKPTTRTTTKVTAANTRNVKVANAKPARKVVPAKVAAPVAATWGSKSILIKELATRKEGFTAAEFKAAIGWKSVSAKAVAERFAATWGNEDGVAYKVVPAARNDGTAAYRWASK